MLTGHRPSLPTGGLAIGELSTAPSYERVGPLFVVLFPRALALFLCTWTCCTCWPGVASRT